MLKNLLLFNLLGACGVALAQGASSVTIQVVVDASARYARNSIGTMTSLASGNNSTSRLVLRGNEDLGDGLWAGFQLESTISADAGGAGAAAPAGQFWDRVSVVKLGSNRWGEIRLGREWTPVFAGFASTDPFFYVGVGSSINFFTPATSTVLGRAFGSAPTPLSRSNNAVQYLLPPGLGGVHGHLMVAAGERGNAGGSYKYGGGRFGWRGSGLDTSLFHESVHIDVANSNFRRLGVAAIYDGGFARLSVSVIQSRFLSSKQTNIIVGVLAPVGQHVVKASYNRVDQAGTSAAGTSVAANDADMFALGYQYNLSKRTALYTQGARIRNHGAARFVIPGGPAGAIAVGSGSTAYEAGIRSSF